MIVQVKKILVVGSKEHLDAFFEKAQEAAILEFIGPERKKIESLELQKLWQAVRILRKRPIHLPPQTFSSVPLSEMVQAILQSHTSFQAMEEKEEELIAEINRVKIFGNFSLEDTQFIEKEGKRCLQYFTMKREETKDYRLPPEVIYVGTDYDLDYLVAIHKEKKSYPQMIEMNIPKPLGVLQEELYETQAKKAKLDKELKESTAYLSLLENRFIQALNEFHLVEAKKNITTPLPSLFTAEAWIPENKIETFHQLIEPFFLFYEEIAIEEEDKVPTYMENEKLSRIGEDLVHIYDTPSQEDTDPSPWVFWFFALFFAMIVADAGYGLLYFIVALILKKKWAHQKAILKRCSHLLLIVSLFCIGWGILTASFLGIEMPLHSPLRKFSLIHYLVKKKAAYHLSHKDDVYEGWLHKYPSLEKATNAQEFLQIGVTKNLEGADKYEIAEEFQDNILMEFSLFLGVIHLSLAFLRYLKKNWAGIGWIVFMIGGYLFFPFLLDATSLLSILGWITKAQGTEIGLYLLYGGITLAVVLALCQNKLSGLAEIMNIIQVFADVLSYLRLYALALAGMIMAATFNEIGAAMGWIGCLVILVGHAVNIVLGIMGGVIHGLRLNFLEWYRYCFVGGGKKFNPLQLIQMK